MEKSITALSRGCHYPVVLLDAATMKVAYKNKAAQVAKVAPRVSAYINSYSDEQVLQILETLDTDSEERIIELGEPPSRCVARVSGDMIVLVFLDPLNLMQKCLSVTIPQIAEITARYDLEKLLISGDAVTDTNKARKLRSYLERYIVDLREKATPHTYCDIREFLRSLESGVSQILAKMGYRISFDMGARDEIFIYRLNESDFLTLNFILISYALSRSVFGVLDVRFEARTSVLTYEFMPADLGEQSESIDLELARLIAKNNGLRLSVAAVDDDVVDYRAAGKARLIVHFG